MSHWKIPGQDDPSLAAERLSTGTFQHEVRAEAIQSVRVDVDRATGEIATLTDVAADEVLEIELEGGLKHWVRSDQCKRDFDEQLQRDRASGDLLIPTYLSFGPRSRGSGLAIRAIQRLKVILAGKLSVKVDPAVKIRNMEKIAENYRKAYELKRLRQGIDDAYPLTNWLTAALALAKRPSTKEVYAHLDEATSQLDAK